MSVYERFIESATSTSSSLSSRTKSVSDKRSMTQLQCTLTSPSKVKNTMHRQKTNLCIPSIINSPASSSPFINKQQYKRLVESDYCNTIIDRHPPCQVEQQICHNNNTRISPNRSINYQQARSMSQSSIDSILDTKDPVLREWLRAMRFETELECLTSLQARTLAIDEASAGAISVRNSQVLIQEMRLESSFILEFIDHLIEALPLMFNTVARFSIEFSELWTRLADQTAAKVNYNQMQINNQPSCLGANNLHNINNNHLTIINCTPRKSQASIKITRPLDKLASQIRAICIECANLLYDYQEINCIQIDNGHLESSLRRLKELYGKFIEISMRVECANIVRALDYDFSQSSLNRLSSSSSLHPVRPFESSSAQLPLKWALIALWQLTKNDSYICRTLTEKWQTQSDSTPALESRVAKRLDYSTKYDSSEPYSSSENETNTGGSSLRSDYQKFCQIYQQQTNSTRTGSNENRTSGALSSAMKTKQQPMVKQVSTIELLIDIIISQPNKHERLDMMNLIHLQAQNDKLIDVGEWDQSVSLAIYTSNQYKVAALRILNHLCVNEQAVKTILKCFSTPPPRQGRPIPENKIIRSIFECYQTSQEHIYQNETMFNVETYNSYKGRKRTLQAHQLEDEELENSDYGYRQGKNSRSDESIDESDDVVVKEAISLLVQLTTPFHRSNQGLDYYTLIGRLSIDSLVKYMTNIIKGTSSREMVFLALTALANISFITTEPMKVYGTNRVILELFRSSKSRSGDLELRDQAVTILANTADKNLLDIVSNGGLKFLLSCLESCPNKMSNYRHLTDRSREEPSSMDNFNMPEVGYIENKPRDRRPIGFGDETPDALGCSCDQSGPSLANGTAGRTIPVMSSCLSTLPTQDLAAMERIHQKTAVAFARMSVDPNITRMILKYGGIKQMIELCKFSHKRNHSDTVLIACIAALRKMSKVVDSEIFKHYNALDLIELDLNRTLGIYGNPRSTIEAQRRLFASDV